MSSLVVRLAVAKYVWKPIQSPSVITFANSLVLIFLPLLLGLQYKSLEYLVTCLIELSRSIACVLLKKLYQALNEPKWYDHIQSFMNTAFFWPISWINLQFHCVNLIGFADLQIN